MAGSTESEGLNKERAKANIDSKPGSIIIIGAGVAGLSAGCYAQMNGYRSQSNSLKCIPNQAEFAPLGNDRVTKLTDVFTG